MLELKNIYKSFETTEVLKDINLEVQKGEIISLLGLSGSGKSTILNIIAGFEDVNRGEVVYKENTISSEDTFIEPQNRNIGFVFQNYALFPHMNIYDNITFGVSKLPRDEKDKIVDGLLKLIDLEGFGKRYPHELSGGQQQRIALVRSMALNPDLILLDEPFSSIDSMAKSSIQKQLLKILKGSGKTAIIVTHDASEAMALSDKIVYLENGSIVQCDTPKNIYNNPKTKQIAKSFGKANFITKDDDCLCIRPKYCSISKEQSDIKAKVVNVVNYGSHRDIFISFRFQSESYAFVIIDNEMFKQYNIDEQVYLNIDFSKGVKLV